MISPKIVKGVFKEKKLLASSYWLFKFLLKQKFDFSPGQYVSVKVSGDGVRRSYSLASLPGLEEISLLVDTAPMGIGSKFFLGLTDGEEVEFLGPLGRFIVNDEVRSGGLPLLFVATGSGLVPEIAMIESLLTSGYRGKISLIWGMRYVDDLFWTDRFEDWKNEFDNFDFSIVLSRPDGRWEGRVGHIDVFLNEKDMLSFGGIYLCGNQMMVESTKEMLVMKQVDIGKIFSERFD